MVHDASISTADGAGGDPSVLMSDRRENYADTRLIRRAIREGWAVPNADRPSIVEKAVQWAKSDDADASLRAMDVLLRMDAADRAEEKAGREGETHDTKSGKGRRTVRKRIIIERVETSQ